MTRIFPGDPFPSDARSTGSGPTSACSPRSRRQWRSACSTTTGAETRLELPERTGQTVHGYLPDISPGPALRLPRPRAVESGRRPALQSEQAAARPVRPRRRRARAVERSRVRVSASASPDERNDADSAPFVPRSVVVNPWFDWEGDQLLRTPWSDTIIYEAHVKGATKLHPDIETELRGTYAGIAHPAFVEHLTSLGVTAVELLPVHQFVHDAHLVERGLRNYWGYNSIGFFAPHNEYDHRGQRGEQVQDFKQMVKALHDAGIEVILDVVYNHTAEGNHLGPMLSFKGIDNAAYYRLVDDDRRHYMDYTGTGNSLNMRNPYVLQLVMDSLRYWVTEMHVDGFRFDLASTLARGLHEVDRLSAFFDLIQQDPTISQVKLIAEPWDVGEGGYQVGNFPPQWAEWNGKYRDCVRDYWRGSDQTPRRVRLPHHRLDRPVRGRRPPAARQHQLHHRARRLHAARPRLVQRQAQRGQRRGQPRRHRRQPLVELRRRGSDRRPRGQRAARAPAAQLPRDAAAVAGHPDAARRRRARPHAAGQQQRLLPGQRDLVVRLGARRRGPARVHPRHDRVPPETTACSAAARSSRAGRSTARASATSRGSRRPATRWRSTTGPRASPRRSACSSTATRWRRAAAARSTPTTASCCCSTPTTSPSRSPSRRHVGATTWEVVTDTTGWTIETEHPIVKAGDRGRCRRSLDGRALPRPVTLRFGRGKASGIACRCGPDEEGAPMPLRGPNRWSDKRERQYEHIKSGLEAPWPQRGRGRGDRGTHGEQGTGPHG